MRKYERRQISRLETDSKTKIFKLFDNLYDSDIFLLINHQNHTAVLRKGEAPIVTGGFILCESLFHPTSVKSSFLCFYKSQPD